MDPFGLEANKGYGSSKADDDFWGSGNQIPKQDVDDFWNNYDSGKMEKGESPKSSKEEVSPVKKKVTTWKVVNAIASNRQKKKVPQLSTIIEILSTLPVERNLGQIADSMKRTSRLMRKTHVLRANHVGSIGIDTDNPSRSGEKSRGGTRVIITPDFSFGTLYVEQVVDYHHGHADMHIYNGLQYQSGKQLLIVVIRRFCIICLQIICTIIKTIQHQM